MPKTKFQNLIFTLLMVFCMVYTMTVFNIACNSGGLSYAVFLTALKEMYVEYIIVFIIIFFVISKLSKRLAFKITDPKTDKPIFVILSIQCFTVCLIVPSITLISTFIHGGFTVSWFTDWLTLAARCFPVAFLLQVFFIGPFVRKIFRMIFKSQLA